MRYHVLVRLSGPLAPLALGALLSACAPAIGLDGYRDSAADPGASGCTAVPSGWAGPSVMYRDGDAPPECGGSWSEPAFSGGAGLADGGCVCQCEPATGTCPTSAQIDLYGAASCSKGSTSVAVSTSCGASPGVLSAGAAVATQLFPIGASCAPRLDKPLAWSDNIRVCDAKASCVEDAPLAEAPAGYQRRRCIHREGEVDCPAGRFRDKQVAFRERDDTRSCGACTCGSPSVAACSVTTTLYIDEQCVTPVATVSHDGHCDVVQAASVRSGKLSATFNGGTCQASGSAAPVSGAATAKSPVTVCCEPSPSP